MPKQHKFYLLFALCLLIILGFWFYSLRTNIQNMSRNGGKNTGQSFANLKDEINKIISKSPLSKNNGQPESDELKELTNKLSEELKKREK